MIVHDLNSAEDQENQIQLLDDFAWNYLQDYEDLSKLQEYFVRALNQAPDNKFPYYQMTCDLLQMMRSCMELQQK